MQRLTGLDAGFLYMETSTSFMHVAGLIIVDPSTSPDEWSFDKVRELYASRLDHAPPFRRRLVEVPFGVHHPIWIEDPDFDLDWHLRHIAVPQPGGRDELTELVAHLVAIPLDRSRPLWETWVISGLEHGHVALLSKVHHAAIDGASGEELMIAVLDLTPEVEEKPPADPPWQPDPVPTDTELLGYAMWSLAQQPVRAVKTAKRTVEVALQLRDRYARPNTLVPTIPFTAPRTSFNHALTPHRSLGLATLELSRVKEVKQRLGCTVNDVILSICGGALRHYLDDRDEHPDGPLVAMVPVSVRSEDQRNAMGNQVSTAFASLATDVDDPVERLHHIHDSMKTAKDAQQLIGADTLQNWVEFAAPAIAARAARVYSRLRVADRHRPLFNVTISNVPGPPFPLYVTGAQVVSTNPIGPIFDGGGLNITVMSYQDRLDFGLLSCPELIPDVQSIADAMADALDELEAASRSIDAGSTDVTDSSATDRTDAEHAAAEPASNGAAAEGAAAESTATEATTAGGTQTTAATRTSKAKGAAKKSTAKKTGTKKPGSTKKATGSGTSAGAKKASGSKASSNARGASTDAIGNALSSAAAAAGEASASPARGDEATNGGTATASGAT